MANNEEIKVEVWDDDGFIELTTDEKRSISTDTPIVIEEIADDDDREEPEAPYPDLNCLCSHQRFLTLTIL